MAKALQVPTEIPKHLRKHKPADVPPGNGAGCSSYRAMPGENMNLAEPYWVCRLVSSRVNLTFWGVYANSKHTHICVPTLQLDVVFKDSCSYCIYTLPTFAGHRIYANHYHYRNAGDVFSLNASASGKHMCWHERIGSKNMRYMLLNYLAFGQNK